MNDCPTPDKLKFEGRRVAVHEAKKRRCLGKFRPYRCVCGFWHLTTISAAGRASARKKRRAAGPR